MHTAQIIFSAFVDGAFKYLPVPRIPRTARIIKTDLLAPRKRSLIEPKLHGVLCFHIDSVQMIVKPFSYR